MNRLRVPQIESLERVEPVRSKGSVLKDTMRDVEQLVNVVRAVLVA